MKIICRHKPNTFSLRLISNTWTDINGTQHSLKLSYLQNNQLGFYTIWSHSSNILILYISSMPVLSSHVDFVLWLPLLLHFLFSTSALPSFSMCGLSLKSLLPIFSISWDFCSPCLLSSKTTTVDWYNCGWAWCRLEQQSLASSVDR